MSSDNATETTPESSSYLDWVYNGFVENPFVKEGFRKYEDVKQLHPFLERSLNSVESVASSGRAMAVDTASGAYRRLYAEPKQRVNSVVCSGVEKTKAVASFGRDSAAMCGTLTLGAGIIAGQLALAASAVSATVVIDGVQTVRRRSSQFVASVEQRLFDAVLEACRVLKVPINTASEKFNDTANAFLDAVIAILVKTVGLEVKQIDDSSIKGRCKQLAVDLYSLANFKARNDVIEPLSSQVNSIVESLHTNLNLVSIVREQGRWASDKLQGSLSDLKTRLETEAAQLNVRPEELLMRGIKSSNQNLLKHLAPLKEKGSEILGESTTFDAFIGYIEEIQSKLGQAEDIYAVQGEVLEELQKRLTQLTTNWKTFRSSSSS